VFLETAPDRRVLRPHQLEYLYISLSNICDARCVYCDVHETQEKFRRFETGFFDDLIAQAKDLGTQRVHFLGGGEPLIDPNFSTAAKAVRQHDMAFVITTNGSKLVERLETDLNGARIGTLVVSLDSHLAQAHDDIRGRAGLFDKACAGIRACLDTHPEARIVLNHVVTELNAGQVPAFLRFARDIGAAAVNLIPVKDSEMLFVSEASRIDLKGILSKSALNEATLPTLLFDQEELLEWVARSSGDRTGQQYRCHFPKTALYLDLATGQAYPCDCTVHRLPEERFQLGNIFEQTLRSIWEGQQIRSLRAVLESPQDPGCKIDCDWNNIRTNRRLARLAEQDLSEQEKA
jgi:MoaA/NifB/PqqE/SkfB family radical SAM enzyme